MVQSFDAPSPPQKWELSQAQHDRQRGARFPIIQHGELQEQSIKDNVSEIIVGNCHGSCEVFSKTICLAVLSEPWSPTCSKGDPISIERAGWCRDLEQVDWRKRQVEVSDSGSLVYTQTWWSKLALQFDVTCSMDLQTWSRVLRPVGFL